MPTALIGLMMCANVLGGAMPAAAVLVDKIVAVVNGEVLTLQDFEDHIALHEVFQPHVADINRQEAFQRFIDQTLIRQEALRTRVVAIDQEEITQHLHAMMEQPGRQARLAQVVQTRSLTMRQVRSWVRQQLIVETFIERRIRLFVRVSDTQIGEYYRQHRQAIGEPFSDIVREQIRRLLLVQQVNARVNELVEELRRKASLDFPP